MDIKILFRPDRWKYVRKLEVIQGCVFCRVENEPLSFDTLGVYKSKHSIILLNKYPYNSGHLLIIPKQHTGDILELSSEQYNDLNHCTLLAVQALRDIYQPHGFNIGANLDKAAGAGIPDHIHYHVIPRYKSDLNFFPLIAETKVISEGLDQCYNKVRTYFDKL